MKDIRIRVETYDGCCTIWYERSKLKNACDVICKRVTNQLMGLNIKEVNVSVIWIMCGPAFEYTFEDFLNDASQEEWDEWEQRAAELELPLDYYLQEFVVCDSWEGGTHPLAL